MDRTSFLKPQSFSITCSSSDALLSSRSPFAALNQRNCVVAASAFSTGSVHNSTKERMVNDPVVSPQWLLSRLNDPSIKVREHAEEVYEFGRSSYLVFGNHN